MIVRDGGSNRAGALTTAFAVVAVAVCMTTLVEAQTCAPASSQFENCAGVTVPTFLAQDVNGSGADFTGSNLRSSTFIRSSLVETLFPETVIASFRYADTDLTRASFRDFAGTSVRFDSVTMTGASFVDARCEACSFNDSTLAGVSFISSSLESNTAFRFSNLQNTQWRSSQVTSTVVTEVDFSGANMFTSVWALVTLRDIKQDNSVLDNSNMIECLHENWVANNLLARSTSFSNHDFRSISLTDCNFAGAIISGEATGFNITSSDFSSVKFRNFVITSSNWNTVDLTGAEFDSVIAAVLTTKDLDGSGSTWSSSIITNSVFDGLKLNSATLTNMRFEDCTFSGDLTADGATFTDVEFIRCIFGDGTMNLDDTESTGIVLMEMKFSDNGFSAQRATMNNADLTGSDMPSGRFDSASLQSARAWGLAAENANFVGVAGSGMSFRSQPLGPSEVRTADLDGADFSNAVLDSAEFTSASLVNVKFNNANLRGASFRFADLSGADFSGADMTSADMSRATGLPEACSSFCSSRGCLCDNVPVCPSGEEPAAGEDCSNVMIKSYEYIGEDFTETRFTDGSLTLVRLDSCKLASTNFNGALLNESEIIVSEAPGATFNEATIENSLFVGVLCSGCVFDDATFSGSSSLTDVDLSSSSFRNALFRNTFSFKNVILTGSDFFRATRVGTASISFENIEATNASFAQASMVDSVFINGTFDDSSFSGAVLSLASFIGASFRRNDFTEALFDGVRMVSASFENSEMQVIDFGGSQLLGSSFLETNLSKASFRGATLDNINFNRADLVGADFTDANITDDSRFIGADCTDIVGVGGCVSFCATRRCICNVATPTPTATATPGPTPDSSATPTPTATPTTTATPTASPTSTPGPTPTPADDGVCFPADATVEVLTKNDMVERVRMDALRMGDRVRVRTAGSVVAGGEDDGEFESVLMFTHKEQNTLARFVTVILEDGRRVTLTRGHYVHVAGERKLVRAEDVPVGARLRTECEKDVRVSEVRTGVLSRGLFNPQTSSGVLYVDGVRVSCYTDAVPPVLAHVLLAPIRVAHALLGRAALLFSLPSGAPHFVHARILAPIKAHMLPLP